MNELIPFIEHDGRRAVSARSLHEFLESKKDFSNWIKDRINKYDFIENQDYVVFAKIGENPSGGRPQIEYALTLDCAKEISMVEGNEKGKQARQYFIACEKEINRIYHFELPQTYSDALRELADRAEENERLQESVKALKPKAEWADHNQDTGGYHTTTAACSNLPIDAGMMNLALIQYKVQRKTGSEYSLTAKYEDKSFGKCFPVPAGTSSDGIERTRLQLKWTEKGRQLIYRVFKHAIKDGYLKQRRDGRYTVNKDGSYGYTVFNFQ